MKRILSVALIITIILSLSLAFSSCQSNNAGETKPNEGAKPDGGTTEHIHTPEVDAAVAPTCTATGLTEGSHCSVCNEVLVKQEEVAIIDHIYNNEDKCTVCNASVPYTEGLEFMLLPDEQSYTVYGMGTATDTYIYIPKTYNNLPVTQIDNYAFRENETITGVRIPNTVIAIDDYTFYDCQKLSKVDIGNSVTSIGDSAFRECIVLSSITIPESVTSIGNSAFSHCLRLASVTIPDGITTINDYAFCMCQSLKSVIIPDGVTSIGDSAFSSCINLSSITIPDSVTSIGDSAFLGCKATSITIPDSVTSIGDYAFQNCSSLTSITIPDSVTSIGFGAFAHTQVIEKERGISYVGNWIVYCDKSVTEVKIKAGTKGIANEAFDKCSALTSVIIPNGITSIGESAFDWCETLTDITFEGTKAEWDAINKASWWDGFTGKYTVHCTDGDISK